MSSPFTRSIAILGLVVILVGACGDDDGRDGTTTTTAATTTSAATTTTGTPSLTLTVEGLSGFEGRTVLGSLFPAQGGGSGGPQGTVCLQVDADPWTGSGVFSTSDPNNPCGKDSPYGEVVAEDGDYSLIVGVYTPGETTPAVCVTTAATISGPSQITVAAADLVPNCTG